MVAAATTLPLIYLLLRAFGAGPQVWALLLTGRMLEILNRSILIVVAVTVVAIAIGVPLAWLTARTNLPFRRFWLVMAALPLVIPTYVSGFVVIVALGPKGMLQGLLQPFGVDRLPDLYGFPGALLVLALHTYPYVMLTTRAALLRVDPALEEVSRALGSGPWSTFWRITWPQIRAGIMAGALAAALYTLGDFGAVSLLKYESFTWAIYLQYESAFDRSLASAFSVVLVMAASLLLITEAWARGHAPLHRAGGGARRSTGIRLGRSRWLAMGFCAVVGSIAVVLPVTMLAWSAFQGLRSGETLRIFSGAAMTSFSVSAIAAVATIVASLPIAVLAVRYPGGASMLLERVSHVGFALPRMAIALGFVFFGANYARPLYQTLFLLVLAYVVVFLPMAVGSVSTSLRQINPRLEEAARALGRKPMEVFASITLPLIWPGMSAGAALVFLLTMEELPITLILRPTGLSTLATTIWSAASEAMFAQAAVPALMLVLVSSLSIILMYRREEAFSS
jgi:iron(III) transport system permease protein